MVAATLLTTSLLWAQNSSLNKVSGNVLDEKNEPFPFVNVLLLKAADSTLAKGLTTNADGNYQFEQVVTGRYFTLVSMVGYQKVYSKPFDVNKGDIPLSPTKLTTSIELLDEITVVAKKPFIEQQIDRTVINVGLSQN